MIGRVLNVVKGLAFWVQGGLLGPAGAFFFILRILHEGHTPAAEAASTEGQQQDTAITL
jgi:hypothetical protein